MRNILTVLILAVWLHTNVHMLLDISRFGVKLLDGVELYVVIIIVALVAVTIERY